MGRASLSVAEPSSIRLFNLCICLRTGDTSKDIALHLLTTQLGRAATCDAVISNKHVSNKHCLVACEIHVFPASGCVFGCRVIIKDVSSNGTWVNNQKIGSHMSMVLENGDLISLDKGSPDLQYRFECFIESAESLESSSPSASSLASSSSFPLVDRTTRALSSTTPNTINTPTARTALERKQEMSERESHGQHRDTPLANNPTQPLIQHPSPRGSNSNNSNNSTSFNHEVSTPSPLSRPSDNYANNSVEKRENVAYTAFYPAPSTVVHGKYELQRILGQGTYSRVFAAVNLLTRQDVAIKVDKEGSPKHMLAWESSVLEALNKQEALHSQSGDGSSGRASVASSPLPVLAHLDFFPNRDPGSPQMLVSQCLNTHAYQTDRRQTDRHMRGDKLIQTG
jgi:pSer/pThr/pTyr-binding forkhead associated (FHA) protein